MFINQLNANKHFELPSPPDDSVQTLSWSPKANFLLSTSWDNQVRVWEVAKQGFSPENPQLRAAPKLQQNGDAPVLTACWHDDGSKIFFSGCDQKVRLWNLQVNQSQIIGQHDGPVRHAIWSNALNMLITGSWDKTLRYWDLRQPTPAFTYQLVERVYAMDSKAFLLVVGLAEKHFIIFDLRQPQKEWKRMSTQLKMQTRVVSCFDSSGFAVGSIEGRVTVQYVEDRDLSKNFSFKCHREDNTVYAVNAVNFHPSFGTFATAGSDGTFHFWDKENRQRLKQFAKLPLPITTAAFNADGSIYSYALGYDWSRGIEHWNKNTQKPAIFLYVPLDSEIKQKKK